MTTSTVFGGRGGIGRLAVEVLAADSAVHSVDLSEPSSARGHDRVTQLTGDATRPDDALRAVLSQSDIVVLAVPEPVLARAARASAPHMRAGSLLVHTSSVQSAGAEPVDEVAAEHGLQSCGLCPMFAPTLNPVGRAVTVSGGRPGDQVDRLVRLVETAGMTVLPISAQEHDRLTAQIQVATHASVLAFGAVLADSDLSLEDLLKATTPPLHLLLMLCARIISSEPEVYREIQGRHPLGVATRKELAAALDRVGEAAESAEEFDVLVASVRRKLDHVRGPLADQCARIMEGLESPASLLARRDPSDESPRV